MTANSPSGAVRLSGEAVIPLPPLESSAPLTAPSADLAWLDRAIGDARVVAIGEPAHYNAEFYRLRHHVLRHLVERHGFSAYATESGFTEGWQVDDWVRGGTADADSAQGFSADADSLGADIDALGDVMANGMTSLMGVWTQMRDHLLWMRRHNRTARRAVGFYGVDLPGSTPSLLPGLDAVTAYLAEADPEFRVDARIRETASVCAAPSPFSAHESLAAYGKLPDAAKDAVTAGLADLTARMAGKRFDYVRRTTAASYERARRSLGVLVSLDAMLRELSRNDPRGAHSDIRDGAIADTVEWILRREDRIVLAAHNGHVQRRPVALPGVPPSATAGTHLADRLGEDYVVIGTTSATGRTLHTGADFYTGTLFEDMAAPRPGSLDAVMDASHDGPFVTDLRHLSPADTETVCAVTEQRFGSFYVEVSAVDAYDLVAHLPHVSSADPDDAALVHAPREVREVFTRWKSR